MTKENLSSVSLKEAFLASPGPTGTKESFLLFVKGLCMGSADIVPGVSGGTIALITGIYEKLLHAIQSVNMEAARALLSFDFKKLLATIHLRFLIVLLAGIGTAVVSLARLMHHLLQHHPVPTWGFFLGLILASILVIGKKIQNWPGVGSAFFIIGTIAAYFLVGMIPVTTPETWWFIFLSGMIAICAMILPGISGSFFLLILGKYQFITGALKNPFQSESILIIIIFGSGCVCGILAFSRFLSYMLDHYHNATLSLLTGLMFGSMRKVWPWKETLESVTIRGKVHVLREQNILPWDFGQEFFLTCVLVLGGFCLVLLLQRLADDR